MKYSPIYLEVLDLLPIFAVEYTITIMTVMQLNAEMLCNIPTDFTREEFFARIEKARTQSGKQFATVEDLNEYIRNIWADTGYSII